MRRLDLQRMLHWLALAALFYILAMYTPHPQLQTLLWKLGHITIASFVGYWVDRNLYGRVSLVDRGERLMARAIIVAAAILGMAFGL